MHLCISMGMMRLFLAITVLLWHCPQGFVSRPISSVLAVQCFYAISGFLIQLAITANYAGADGWVRRFYLSRLLRIYPLYLTFFALTVALVGSGHFGYYVQRS